jgi:DNA helicase IV
LKATGYQWQSTGWPGWAKSFPADGFNIETIKKEVWNSRADGIEVRIFDDTDTLAARFLINAGDWQCEIDQLATLCPAKEESNDAAQREERSHQ